MFKDLLIDFLRRYWWGAVAIVVLIVGGIWLYTDSQKVEVGGHKVSPAVAEALEYYQRNELDEAQSRFESIVKAHPRDWYAWTFLGNVYRDENKYGEAETAYLKSLNINPRFEQGYRNAYIFYYVWSHDDPDQLQKAEELLLKGLKSLPKSEIIMEDLLNYYQKTNNQEKFLIYQDKLSKLRNSTPSSVLNTLEFN